MARLAAIKSKPVAKIITAKTEIKSQNTVRQRKLPRRTKKKIDKTVKRSNKIPPARKILWGALRHIWAHKKVFLGILLVYGILNLVLVKGVANNFQITGLKNELSSTFDESANTFDTSLALFGVLIGSSGTTSGESGSVYQVFLLVIASLALIWALRHTYEKQVKVTVRDSFYKGMYPFIPVILVLLVVILQLLPMLIGTSIYSVVQNGGLAVTLIEKMLWLLLLIVSVGASFYMVSSSIFALYIVTLPDMTPMRALRAARKLVKFRRWTIFRKVFFLPAVILLVAAIGLIPLIIVLPIAADILYTIAAILTLGVVHGYGYALYRELL